MITMFDVEDLGIQRAMDIALEIAWKGADAVYLSFDTRLTAEERARAEQERNRAAGMDAAPS